MDKPKRGWHGARSVKAEDGVLRFAYNHYGEMSVTDAGRPESGRHTITLRANTGDAFTWDFTVDIDEESEED